MTGCGCAQHGWVCSRRMLTLFVLMSRFFREAFGIKAEDFLVRIWHQLKSDKVVHLCVHVTCVLCACDLCIVCM